MSHAHTQNHDDGDYEYDTFEGDFEEEPVADAGDADSTPQWLRADDFKPQIQKQPQPQPQPQPQTHAHAQQVIRPSRRQGGTARSATQHHGGLDREICSSVTRVTMDDVELIQGGDGNTANDPPIAGGGFSLVYKAKWLDHTLVAVKRIFDPVMLSEDTKRGFVNEVNMLARLRHPNIVSLFAVCPHPPALLIVTEFMHGGNLHQLLHESQLMVHRQSQIPATGQRGALRLSRDTLIHIAKECAKSIHFVHHQKVVHGDIKPSNFLLDDGDLNAVHSSNNSKHPHAPRIRVKLCDFGTARSLEQFAEEIKEGFLQATGGTPAYMAPEMFTAASNQAADNLDPAEVFKLACKADVYALGTLLNELFSRQIPWQGLDVETIRHRVVVEHKRPALIQQEHSSRQSAGRGYDAQTDNQGVPDGLVSLIQQCWSPQPQHRPTVKDIIMALEKL